MSALSIPAVARVHRVVTDLAAIEAALESYQKKHGKYPETQTGLSALIESKLIKTLPTDSWGRVYLYTRNNNSYVVWSLGRDGAIGGKGEDHDYSTSNKEANQTNIKFVSRKHSWINTASVVVPAVVLFLVFMLVYYIIRKNIKISHKSESK